MTYVIKITPDGEVTRCPERWVLDAAHIDYATTDVVVLNHPMLPPRKWVGVVSDWGAVDGLPINWKAWALYGRSAIYGTMWVGHDDRLPLGDALIEYISGDGWYDELKPAMETWLRENPVPTITVETVDPRTGRVTSTESFPARRPQ